jgi:hypothetical protein
LTSIVVSFCGKQLYSVLARVSPPLSLSLHTSSFSIRATGSGSVVSPACGHSVMFVPRVTSRSSTTLDGSANRSIFAVLGEFSQPAAAVPAQSTTNAATALAGAANAKPRFTLSPFRCLGAQGAPCGVRL